jgi:hypothetical protein
VYYTPKLLGRWTVSCWFCAVVLWTIRFWLLCWRSPRVLHTHTHTHTHNMTLKYDISTRGRQHRDWHPVRGNETSQYGKRMWRIYPDAAVFIERAIVYLPNVSVWLCLLLQRSRVRILVILSVICVFSSVPSRKWYKSSLKYVGFEVLTAVVMKNIIFWDITPCSPLSVNRRFGGTYRLHFHSQKNKPSKKPAWKQVASRSC